MGNTPESNVNISFIVCRHLLLHIISVLLSQNTSNRQTHTSFVDFYSAHKCLSRVFLNKYSIFYKHVSDIYTKIRMSNQPPHNF